MAWWFYVAVFGGPLLLVTIVLSVVFWAVRRALERAIDEISGEGIELDSGVVKLTTRYDSFSSARVSASKMVGLGRARLVLTKQRFHVIKRPQRYGIFARAALPRLTVGVLDGRLHIRSEDPPEATGIFDYRAQVADPQAWVEALAAAGAVRK
jgi:hypothetical protein